MHHERNPLGDVHFISNRLFFTYLLSINVAEIAQWDARMRWWNARNMKSTQQLRNIVHAIVNWNPTKIRATAVWGWMGKPYSTIHLHCEPDGIRKRSIFWIFEVYENYVYEIESTLIKSEYNMTIVLQSTSLILLYVVTSLLLDDFETYAWRSPVWSYDLWFLYLKSVFYSVHAVSTATLSYSKLHSTLYRECQLASPKIDSCSSGLVLLHMYQLTLIRKSIIRPN